MKKIATGLFAFSLVVLMGQGCNPFQNFGQRAGEKAVEQTIEQQTGAQVDLGIDGEAKLPDNFPDDVPRYPNAKYVSAIVTNEGKVAIAYFTTKDSSDDIQHWFQTQLEGDDFTLDTTFAIGGSIQYYTKGDVKITVQAQEEDGETTVSLQRAE